MKQPLLVTALILVTTLAQQTAAQPLSKGNGSAAAPYWMTPEVKAPGVSFHTFESSAAESRVSYHIYTPAAYEKETQRRFPVVYWLHGSGGGLAGLGKVASLFNDAIGARKVPPCFVVFVNGLVEGMYVDWKDGSVPIETIIVKELVPHIDATYRTIATREGRLLDGYSMGGYGAARLGFKHSELFRAVSIMGGGPLQAELVQAPRAGRQRATEVLQQVYGGDQEHFKNVSPRRLAEQNAEEISKNSLVRQVCGDQDETFGPNRDFHEHLERLKIPHTWTILAGIDHNPMKTLEALGDSNWTFYRAAFGDPTNTGTAASNPLNDTPIEAKPDTLIIFKVQEQERRAIVVNGSKELSKRPAVIVLHGGMGSAAQMRATSGFDKVAKANGFMAVYAQGTDFGGGRHAWNTGFLLRRQVQDADDIAYFDNLIKTLVREHGADPTRIYMTGGSNGGMMTFVYAVARAERLAAVAPIVSSMFTFENVPSVPLPILIINGAKDEEIPIQGGMSRNPLVRRAQEAPYKPLTEVVQFWVRANKSDAKPKTSVIGTATTSTYSIAPGEGLGAITEYVVDSEGAHGWPGSPSRREGVVPIASFSGAERVWHFFMDKQRLLNGNTELENDQQK